MKIYYFLVALAAFSFITSCKKEGCTNPEALNYDKEAKEDDGSCVFLNKNEVSNDKLKGDWEVSSMMYAGTEYKGVGFDEMFIAFQKLDAQGGTSNKTIVAGGSSTTQTGNYKITAEGKSLSFDNNIFVVNFNSNIAVTLSGTDSNGFSIVYTLEKL